jgi:hypothetical protein
LSPHTILTHLRDSFEVEYCDPRLVAEVLQLSGKILADQYGPLYERLRVKECFLYKQFSERFSFQNAKLSSAGVDESEILVDTI